MAKNVLKAWLVDNTVTTDDKTDKIFQLEMTRSIDKELILDRMVAKNPGVRRETMSLGIELYEEVISEALMNGESVNTGLFRGVAQFRGVAAIEKTNEERYRALLKNVETKSVFEKAGVQVWECRNCGHIVVGTSAPAVCPVCAHPQAYFEVRKENY